VQASAEVARLAVANSLRLCTSYHDSWAPTRRRLKHGVFRSIIEPQAAINRHLPEHNAGPQTVRLGKRADQILAKLNRMNASMH
jgi:hypothetical protein